MEPMGLRRLIEAGPQPLRFLPGRRITTAFRSCHSECRSYKSVGADGVRVELKEVDFLS